MRKSGMLVAIALVSLGVVAVQAMTSCDEFPAGVRARCESEWRDFQARGGGRTVPGWSGVMGTSGDSLWPEFVEQFNQKLAAQQKGRR